MIRPRIIINNLGRIVLIVGVAMLTCLFWSVPYKEDVSLGILAAAGITIFSGFICTFLFRTRETINFKEGFAVVSLGWLVASIFGALPFFTTGWLPAFTDAWFESMSGFTTTGASVIKDVEIWPKGLLYWRALTQWLGGIGIIALFVVVISNIGARANQLFKAEVPGPISEKISPRIRETAKSLWKTYAILSVACVITLYALGMNFFDALCHTFTTLATGGFSTKNASIAYYSSPWIQWAIIFFMFAAGVNFGLHYMFYKKRSPGVYIQNTEFKLYAAIVLGATLLIAVNLTSYSASGAMMSWEERIRTACFQVVSISTTTGFATADYDLWPSAAGIILLLMMFVGGCAGSTGGSIKPGRYLIIFRRSLIELKRMIHPKAVIPLRFGEKVLSDDLVINVQQFFFLYMTFLVAGMATMCMLGMDLVSGLTASASCLGNIGPGFGDVGPTRNFSFVPLLGKIVLTLEMLVGRLEIYPLLVLFLPGFWRE